MKKIKMFTATFLFAGLFAMAGSNDNSAVAPGNDDTSANSCWGCCPTEICGYNGPALDGSTDENPEQVSSCEDQSR